MNGQDLSCAKPTSGTKEWAVCSVNCSRGCCNDCVYCYGRDMAVRFHRVTPEQWPKDVVLEHQVNRKRGRVAGLIMFPSTHDITPGNLSACLTVLRNLLEAGNRILVVSKPRLDCIQRLCEELANRKDQILFRFTIGVINNNLRRFWEPGAPDFDERLASLRWAFEANFQTSVSVEPLLEPWNVRTLVNTVRPFVTHSIWIGKANHLRRRTAWILRPDDPELLKLESWQSDEKVLEIYQMFKADPLIRWKDSYKKIIGIPRSHEAGLDI